MGEFDRDITLRGNFSRAVIVNDSFVNGKDCVYVENHDDRYSHAEGFMSEAKGQYSHADGVLAYTEDPRSYVWSGIKPSSDPKNQEKKKSNGEGTYSIYTNSSTNSTATSGLNEFYLNGTQFLYFFEKYKNDTKNEILGGENNWTELNTFGGGNEKGIRIADGASFSTDNNSTVMINGQASFGGSVTRTTLSTGVSSNEVATTAFVHEVVRQYLTNIFGDDILKTE